MDYKFYITFDGITTEIEEPVGWDDIETILKREKTHGISFEVAIGGLGFYGVAYKAIVDTIKRYGFNASIIFTAKWRCNSVWSDFYNGRISVSSGFNASNDGIVNCVLQSNDAVSLFNSRIDLSVNLLSSISIGGVAIDNPSKDIKVNGQFLNYATKGVIDTGGWKSANLMDSPTHHNDIGAGVVQHLGGYYPLWKTICSDLGELNGTSGWCEFEDTYSNRDATFNVISELFGNSSVKLENGSVLVKVRIKGRIKGNLVTKVSSGYSSLFRLYRGGQYDTIFSSSEAYDFTNGFEFDKTLSFGIVPGSADSKIAIYFTFELFSDSTYNQSDLRIELDSDSFVNIQCTTSYTPSSTSVRGLYYFDAIKTASDIITDKKLIVAMGTNISLDTLAKNLALTSGKYVRNAKSADGSPNPINASFKELYNALDCIIPIGIGMDNGIMVVDGWQSFYRDGIIADFGDVAVKRKVDESMIVTTAKVGYSKSSSRGYGLTEDPFSERSYAATLEDVGSNLDKLCKFIGSGFLREECRRESTSINGSGGSNDDSLFVLLCKDGLAETEDQTHYNGEYMWVYVTNIGLTPRRNALRWAKFCAVGKLGISTDNRVLIFSAGTGNTKAIIDGMSEFSSIGLDEITPMNLSTLPSPYVDSFDAPLSKAEYEAIKANQYSKVKYGSVEGYIKEVKYKPSKGEASIQVNPTLATFNQLYNVCSNTTSQVNHPVDPPVETPLTPRLLFEENFMNPAGVFPHQYPALWVYERRKDASGQPDENLYLSPSDEGMICTRKLPYTGQILLWYDIESNCGVKPWGNMEVYLEWKGLATGSIIINLHDENKQVVGHAYGLDHPPSDYHWTFKPVLKSTEKAKYFSFMFALGSNYAGSDQQIFYIKKLSLKIV